MTEAIACPRCGAALPAEAPAGLCAQCRRQQAFANAGATPGRASDPTLAPRPASPPGEGAGAGHRYFGDYEILGEIARGGMGVVYKARQISLDRLVALKMILAGQLAAECDVERFYTEARAAGNLQHPNIVAIHEVGQHDGQHYFSMDYVEGQSLASLVEKGPLPVPKAVAYVRAIADAIHYAHEHGILHRDLKPSNILIDKFDQPRITDFGIAKRLGAQEIPRSGASSSAETPSTTAAGELLGTPSYMSPEQIDAEPGQVGPACDVYALGAVLYELLTGRPPFQAGSARDTLLQVLQLPPVGVRRLNRRVPRALEQICLKCLEKDPARRYRTAAALADDLSRFELGQETLAGTADKALVPRIVLGSALACLLLCCGGPLLFFGWWFPNWHSKHKESLAQKFGTAFESIRTKVSDHIQMQELAKAWRPPADDSGPAALFPPRVGPFSLSGREEKAAIPEFRIDQPGWKADYKSAAATIEFFVFHANRKEREAVFHRVNESFNDDFVRVAGDNFVHYAYKFAGRMRSGSLLWTADRLVLARTSDGADTDDFLRSYFRVFSPAAGPAQLASNQSAKSVPFFDASDGSDSDEEGADERARHPPPTSTPSESASSWLSLSMLVKLAIVGVICAGLWRVFSKAGLPGWGALIPVYNLVLWMRLGGKPGWWAIWLFVPFLNFVIYTIVTFEVARNFGKGVAYTLGLLLLPPLFYPLLGLGPAEYNRTLLHLRLQAVAA